MQYGCGPASCPPGWLSFDASPTLRLQRLPVVGPLFRRGRTVFPEDVRLGDIVAGLPIADGSARGVYASHVLEHLSLEDFHVALANTFRVLAPGGVFRLIMPDLQGRARRYLERVEAGDAEANCWFMRSTYLGVESRPRGLVALARGALGNSAHLWMWDEASMTRALEAAGFTAVRRCRFNDGADPAFRAVEDAGRFHDETTGLDECAMEAIRPA